MGFRFRKSVKIAPCFRLNFSNKGVGYSVGGKGFTYSKSPSGQRRATASIPGTGLSWTERLDGRGPSGSRRGPSSASTSRPKSSSGAGRSSAVPPTAGARGGFEVPEHGSNGSHFASGSHMPPAPEPADVSGQKSPWPLVAAVVGLFVSVALWPLGFVLGALSILMYVGWRRGGGTVAAPKSTVVMIVLCLMCAFGSALPSEKPADVGSEGATQTASDARTSTTDAQTNALPDASVLEQGDGSDVRQSQDSEVTAPYEAPSSDAVDVEGTLTAYFLNVGQGDSEFVVLPDGKTMLIDAGESWAGDAVVDYVQNVLGYDRIDFLVATHAHSDHVGGMKAVLWSPIFIEQVFAPEVPEGTDAFYEFLDAAQTVDKQVTPAVSGLVIDEGYGLSVEVLSPDAGAVFGDENDWSVVVKVTWGDTSLLFTGDASYKVIDGIETGEIDVLKVGHHGSDTSTSIPTIEKMGPSVAVIEVGWGNDYGHPSVETLDELDYCGVQVWRTDVDGTVVVTSDGRNVSVSSDTGATVPASREFVEALQAQDVRAAEEERLAAEAEAAQVEEEQWQPAATTVYITNTGAKYHKAGCRTLKDSSIEVDLDYAIASGYEPCGICYK